MPGFRSATFSTPSRKLAVLKAGRGSRPGFSSSRKMSVTVGTPNTALANASGLQLAQRFQLALAGRENAPHDGVGFRMYARPVERIVTITDAQEPCRKLESLGTEPRHLLKDRA